MQDVAIDASIPVPAWPECLTRNVTWQTHYGHSKENVRAFRLTAGESLQVQKKIWREATANEKHDCAEQYGFQSWEAFQNAYRNWSDEQIRDAGLPRPRIGDMTRDWQWVSSSATDEIVCCFTVPDEHVPTPTVLLWRVSVIDGSLDEITFLGDKQRRTYGDSQAARTYGRSILDMVADSL